jgi:hypothetical protein
MSVGVELPPPPPVLERGDGGGGWVRLIAARNDIDAHLLVGRLQEAGVETRSVKDRCTPGAWLYGGSDPWAPVTIWVRRAQLDEARLVLAEISLHDEGPRPLRRSQEGGWRSLWAWWAVALGVGVLLMLLSLSQATAQAAAAGASAGRASHGVSARSVR